MQTKLNRFCDGLIEAVCICAFIVIPLFFNTLSSRIFEPDKVALLRTLTLLALAAWVTKIIDQQAAINWVGLKRENLANQIRASLKIPLIIPVIGLVIIYGVATVFSVTGATSFWGSYQRLQGTYTTFSYILLFLIVVWNFRRKEQVDRLISIGILTSLPISIYGLIQRFGLDPIPWAGNVTVRVTGNMGNSIFIAAFLIIVFPLTVIRFLQAIKTILQAQKNSFTNFYQAVVYLFIALLQILAIYFSGSRGPWLGLGLSVMILWLGLSVIWEKRWLARTGLGLAFAASLFILLLNVPESPLSSLRTIPEIGRLGQLLDAESRTGRVRTLIWQGAVDLVVPHEPLEYPDGSRDPVNFLRPLIGYGPESMFVAFNRFYQPELAEVEKRNASPDRSHNETWDSLIFTGIIGLVCYFFLFGSIIYFALKWLGFIGNSKQTKFFLGIVIGCGILSAGFFYFWKGAHYLGVGLPFGMVLGVFLFLAFRAAFFLPGSTPSPLNEYQKVLVLSIFAAIMAHFMELIFGFGITATRTYFWMFAGIFVVLGTNSLTDLANETTEQPVVDPNKAQEKNVVSAGSPRKSGKTMKSSRQVPARSRSTTLNRTQGTRTDRTPSWLVSGILGGLIIAITLITLGFDFISVQADRSSIVALLRSSMIENPLKPDQNNFGVLLMLFSSWIIFGLVLNGSYQFNSSNKNRLANFGIMLGLSLFLFLLFLWIHATSLAIISQTNPGNIDDVLEQVKNYEAIYLRYVITLLVILFFIGLFLVEKWPEVSFTGIGIMVGIPLIILALVLGLFTNQRVIQADIAFKAADSFTTPGYWPAAITIYHRALELSPNEDYYYLFLARAYLEYAKTMENDTQRLQLINQAEKDMLKAQTINPLNTDHTANLARIHTTWAEYVEDQEEKDYHTARASEYYDAASRLSPFNARLWGEWAFLLFSQVADFDQAKEKLDKALEIDPTYEWLYSLQGEFYFQQAELLPGQDAEKNIFYQKALEAYQEGLNLIPENDVASRYRNFLSIARTFSRLKQYEDAIQTYLNALAIYPGTPDAWRIQEVVARLFLEIGDHDQALFYAESSKDLAPEDQDSRLDELIELIRNSP